ncbi:hypothetical protein ACP0HM_01340 [Escherichia coli]
MAKLSDSSGKTICHDKAFVRALRKAFDLPHIKKPVNIIRELIGSLFTFLIPKSFAAFANSACLIADAG